MLLMEEVETLTTVESVPAAQTAAEKTPVLIDVDDLICESQITDLLVPLLDQRPDLLVHAYAVPNRLGPVHELRVRYPWLRFCTHGWQHTKGECLAWTEDEAREHLRCASEMGYERVFKAPDWLLDVETERACAAEGFILHTHPRSPVKTPGVKVYSASGGGINGHFNLHTHILRNPATDFISEHPGFRDLNVFGRCLRIEEVAR